jgi:cyclohexa-1,5-dienecarbonyl-CoA hydratase
MSQPYATITADLLEDGTLLRLVLNQPRGNILTTTMTRELADALRRHQQDPHLRLVLVRGAGGNFSYGASVEEHRRDQAPAMLRAFHGVLRELAAYPVPVAALVEGRCLGGGFELALCCHFLCATTSARFGCPEIKLGVFPPVFAVVGAQRMGGLLAERLLLTGGEMDAATAERAGLLALTIAGDGDPEGAVLDWYRTHLRPLSAFALRQATAAGRHGSGLLAQLGTALDAAERQYVTAVVESHDGNEGIEAFLARRAPVWQDA